MLEDISLHSSFDKVGIVNENGAGYFANGESIYIDPGKMKNVLLCSGAPLPLNNKVAENDLIFGVPYYRAGQSAGMIFGVVSLQTAVATIRSEVLESLQAVYLINDQGETLVKYNMTGEVLDYTNVSKKQFYEKEKWMQSKDLLRRAIYQFLSQDKNASEVEMMQLISDKGLIWYKHRIAKRIEPGLTLLVVRKACMSSEISQLFTHTARAASALALTFFCFLIVMLISNRLAQRRLGMLAYMDMVTEGDNWNKLKQDAKRLVKKRRSRKYAMVTLDIDHFKVINDIHGHNKGNKILKDTMITVKRQLRKKETVARYSGDIFAVFIYYEDEQSLRERLIKWQTALRDALEIEGLSFSFGIYVICDYALSLDRMCIYASHARETVKKEREDKIAFFDETLRQKILKEQEIESHMEEALEKKEFKVYLQPKYPPAGGKMGGAEALVRWISPTQGFISPGEFIPIFEKNAFIIQLDEYMLEEVCKEQRKWLDEEKEIIPISVNISRTHLLDEQLVPRIVQLVDRYGLPHECIELELTESAFFDDKKKLIETVDKLKDSGFVVSMDDFGVGYSSLNTLKDLPFDVIKLDGEFFKKMANQERSRIIIEDTIKMAKRLKLQIVAEGIEEKEQVDFLKDIGCNLIQGFYFAKPMPVDEFERLL